MSCSNVASARCSLVFFILQDETEQVLTTSVNIRQVRHFFLKGPGLKQSLISSKVTGEMLLVVNYGTLPPSSDLLPVHASFQSWKDEFLKWNKADYAGIDQILLPVSMVWTPDIQLFNR